MSENYSETKPVLLSRLQALLKAALGLAFLVTHSAIGQSVTLAWNASPDANAIGYFLYAGTDGVTFKRMIDAGTNTIATVTNMTVGATNYFEVTAYDANNNESPPTATVSYFVPGTNQNVAGGGSSTQGNVGSNPNTNSSGTASFILTVSGHGAVSPQRGTKSFLPGQKYTSVAVPAKGSVFAGWTSNGVEVSASPRYTFFPNANIALQANFITNPFVPVMGAYHGLFYVSSNAAPESSGSFTATVMSSGAFTAKIQLAGRTYSYAEAFSVSGATAKTINRPGLTPLNVQLQLGLTNGPLTGTISDGTWTADLVADPLVYSRLNPARQAGRYTMVIPGSTNAAAQPGGNGYGAVNISTSGTVTFSGVLGDGTPVTATSIISSEGQWPLYASLYGGKGSILGWLSFTNLNEVNGETGWFKLPQASAKYYAGGFTNSASVIGSSFHYTNGVPVLPFAEGQVSMINGNLSETLTNQVIVGSPGIHTDDVAISPSTGLFKVSVLNPATGKPVFVKGAILQNQNAGAGLFLGSTETGSAVLSNEP